MIVNRFSTRPGFPFEHYFEDVQQYIAAQEYWAAVLRASPGFNDADWQPVRRPVDLEDDMYSGSVLSIVNWDARKHIAVQTFSLPGDINMAIKENGPVDPKHIPEGLDEDTKAKIAAGIPEAELRDTATADYTGFMSWDEPAELWRNDPETGDGGLVALSKLILTSEISARAENLALEALETFLNGK